jgi:hypothetical protein
VIEAMPAADGLTVRVINNVIKRCEVRCQESRPAATLVPIAAVVIVILQPGLQVDDSSSQRVSPTSFNLLAPACCACAQVKPKFVETFGPQGYPDSFPFRQRVVVLFQRIDGVDVALYCMYVQEYGSDCPPPNR